jgi:signal peptidase II
MATSRIIKTFFILLTILVNIGCDQVSKKIVRKNVNPHETIPIVNDRVIVTNVENSGAFLSLGDSLPSPVRVIVLNILPLIALGLGFFYVLSKPELPRASAIGFSFVIGGGIGNIFDRVVYGSVTDFLHIDFGFFQTGIFNMADLSIVMGAAIILVKSLFRSR